MLFHIKRDTTSRVFTGQLCEWVVPAGTID
jgi:hypothetical protein